MADLEFFEVEGNESFDFSADGKFEQGVKATELVKVLQIVTGILTSEFGSIRHNGLVSFYIDQQTIKLRLRFNRSIMKQRSKEGLLEENAVPHFFFICLPKLMLYVN